MSIHFKKSIVFGCALAAAITLSACGDDSSSSPNQENDNPSSSSTGDSTINSSDDGTGNETGSDKNSGNGGTSAPNGGAGGNSDPLPAGFEDGVRLDFNLTIDEAAKTFSMTLADQANMACVRELESIEWKSVSKDPLAETIKYDFVGDSLVMYNWDSYDNAFETEGVLYVGGSAGSLNGSWKYTPCMYDSDMGKSRCFDDLDESFDALITFSTNTLTIVQKSGANEFDYSKTEFRAYLLSSINRGYNMFPSVYDLFYNSESTENFENIEELNPTKTGETFKYKGTVYTVNVPKIQKTGISRSITVEVASAAKKCTGSYEAASFVTKELCSEDNSDYLEFDSEEDENGNIFHYADYYEKENNIEFENCLMDLFGISEDDGIIYDDYVPMYKKAAKKNSKKRQNIFMNLF